jgi:FeS assembly SUF system protein
MEDLQTPQGPREPQENSNVEAQASPTLNGLEEKIVEVLKTCYDPEIPVDIYELGLIYGIKVGPEGEVDIDMTLTSPACPAAGSLPPEVERKVADLDGVRTVKVNVVWDPVWTPEKMTEAARLQLGMF